jgi:phosphoadenosine phosphosulfate reductase
MSASTVSIGESKHQLNAIHLHAKPSTTFAEKVAESLALLQQAVANFSPVTQASSLGAEDVVIHT